jgi:hypothetical protein
MVELNPMESRGLRAALGEVCFGFEVPHFSTVIGCTEDEARALFRKLDHFDLDQSNAITLSITELRAIRNAHVETLRTLGEQEFQTRVGVAFLEGQEIAQELERALSPFVEPTRSALS